VRILIIDTCYPAFLERHYAARPSLRAASYGDQWRALMDTFFGTADAYSHNLRALGHDAHEVVANCVPLQHAWAREHGHTRDIRGVSPEESIVVEQARAFEPDVVYVQHVHFLSDEALMRLKEISGFLVGQIATEPPRASRLRRFDLLVTCLPPFAERFRAQGVPTELLRLGFDERALTRVEATGAERGVHPAVFVGSLGRTQHRRANAHLARAARRAPLEFWGYNTRLWPPWSPVRRRYHGEAWGLDMYRVLYESRIAVNRHGGIAGNFAVNMRLYEASGMGALLLTDGGESLDRLFGIGQELVVWNTASELQELIHHYLRDEAARREIAAAGQRRTLREHTYAHRMQELVSILERHQP